METEQLSHTDSAERLTEAERRTVEENLPLVRHIVRRLAGRFPSSYAEDDLIQTGMVGLIEATRRFDPDRGIAFSTYAGRRIEGAVYDLMRREDWLPRSRRAVERRIGAAERRLTSERGERPTDLAIAEATGLTAQQVASTKHHVWKARVDSLDRPVGGLESTLPLGETIMCGESGPDTDLDQAELLGYLRDGLALLPERHRLVLVGCFFEGRTVTEVGLLLGVTQSRASQLKNEAIEMLRIGLEFQFAEHADDDSRGRQRQFNQDLAERTDWRERAELRIVA